MTAAQKAILGVLAAVDLALFALWLGIRAAGGM